MLILNQDANTIHNLRNIDAITISAEKSVQMNKHESIFKNETKYKVEALIDYGSNEDETVYILGTYNTYDDAKEVLASIFTCKSERFIMPEGTDYE